METLHTSPIRLEELDELEASLALLTELAPATPVEHDETLVDPIDLEDYSEPIADFAKRIAKEPVAKTVTLDTASYTETKKETGSGGPQPGGNSFEQDDKVEHESGCLKMNCSCEEKHNAKGKTLKL